MSRPLKSDNPTVRVSKTSKIALLEAARTVCRATGEQQSVGSMLDDLVARHLPEIVAERVGSTANSRGE